LGRIFWDAGRNEEALVQYTKATALDSTFVEGWVLRGYLELRTSHPEAAVESFRRASALEPKEPMLHFYVGLSLNQLKRYEEAVSSFDEVLAINANHAEAMFARGISLDQLGRTTEAATSFRRVVELQPRNGEAMNYLGYMLAEKGLELEEAVSVLQKAVALEPENGAFLDSLGWAYFKQGKMHDARKYLEKAVEESGSDATILEHLGDVHQAMGDEKKAQEAWKKAHEVDPAAPGPKSKLEGSLSTP
jgi:Flp pilus assembly protein TadD